jgi:hypothetical protein
VTPKKLIVWSAEAVSGFARRIRRMSGARRSGRPKDEVGFGVIWLRPGLITRIDTPKDIQTRMKERKYLTRLTVLEISCRKRTDVLLKRVLRGSSSRDSSPCGGPMPRTESPEIDELLAKWGAGDREASRALIPLRYEELRRVARQQLCRAPSPRTLQTTALVHEAYMRLHHQFPGAVSEQVAFHRRVCVAYATDRGRLRAGKARGEERRRCEELYPRGRSRGDEGLPAGAGCAAICARRSGTYLHRECCGLSERPQAMTPRMCFVSSL